MKHALLILTILAATWGSAFSQALPPAAPTQPATAPTNALGDPLPPDTVACLGTARLRVKAYGGGSAILSADGKMLYAADGNDISIWQASDGREVGRLHDDQLVLRVLAVSPDQSRLVCQSAGGKLRLWDLAALKRIQSPLEQINALGAGLDPAGKTLTILCNNGAELVAWADANTGAMLPRKVPRPASGQSAGAAISGDGRIAAVQNIRPDPNAPPGARGIASMIWNIRFYQDGNEAGELPSGTGVPVVVRLSRDGAFAAVYDHTGQLRLWDRKTGGNRDCNIAISSRVADLQVSSDGKRVWILEDRGRVTAWTAGAEGPSFELATAILGGSVWLSLSADESVLAYPDGQSTGVVDARTGKRLLDLPGHTAAVTAMRFTADGHTLATGTADGQRLWDVPSGRCKMVMGSSAMGSACLAFRPDEKILASAGVMRPLQFRSVADGSLLAESMQAARGAAVIGIEAADSNEWLALTNTGAAQWLDANGSVLREMAVGPNPCSYAMNRDRTVLATSTQIPSMRERPARIHIWDVGERKLMTSVPGEIKNLGAMAFSPCGEYLAVGDQSATSRVTIYEVASGKTAMALDVGACLSLAWSPDGRFIACGDHVAGGARVYSTARGQFVREFVGRGGGVHCLAFSPDGRYLAGGMSDTTVLLWDMAAANRAAATLPAAAEPAEALDLAKAWDALGHDDAPAAYRAAQTFAEGGKEALDFLAAHAKPEEAADPNCVKALVVLLDSDSQDERNRASAELATLGGLDWDSLLKDAAGEEVRSRLEALKDRSVGAALAGKPSAIRSLRVIVICRRIGGAGAVEILRKISGGPANFLTTRQAKIAVEALSRTQ